MRMVRSLAEFSVLPDLLKGSEKNLYIFMAQLMWIYIANLKEDPRPAGVVIEDWLEQFEKE
jgi:hypothetical protein